MDRTEAHGMSEQRLSHTDDAGRARMVDVTAKGETVRVALAKGRVVMKPETLRLLLRGESAKGNGRARGGLRADDGAGGGRDGGEAPARADPDVPPAAPDGHRRRAGAGRGGERRRDHGDGAHDGQDGRRDGGAYGGGERRANGLLHVQGGGPGRGTP